MTSRPLSMACRDMLFVHWPIEPERLRSHIPAQLTLDTFDGSAWLAILPHYVAEVKARSIPNRISFPQLNFRTYVSKDGYSGVYFIDLYGGNRLGTEVGKRVFGLPYNQANMSFSRSDDEIEFRCSNSRQNGESTLFKTRYRPNGERFQASPDSIEEFLIERSRYYVPTDRDDSPSNRHTPLHDVTIRTGDIVHEPWQLQSAQAAILTNKIFETNGIEAPTTEPIFHYSRRFDSKFGLLHSDD